MKLMKKNFHQFALESLANFWKAIANLLMFCPYFFSVNHLLKTLFKPWKNISTKKTTPGFSFEEVFGRISFNLISVFMGFIMRLCLLTAFLLTQIFLVISIPFFLVAFLAFLPLRYFISSLQTPFEDQIAKMKQIFVAAHLLNTANHQKVADWFDYYYVSQIKKLPWWQIKSLFSIPPLARDWNAGFTPTLDQYVDELTVAKPHYKHLVDRENEIKQIEQVLAKSDEANVIVVGEEGVGKHTIIEGLAKKIYEGYTIPILSYKRILKLDVEKIISQSIDLSQKEALLKKILKEAAEGGNIIIFIENLEKYIATTSETTDLTAQIAAFAQTDRLQFIAIMTPFIYQSRVSSNDKINRLFEKIDVGEVSPTDAEKILLDNFSTYEQKYNVVIPYETILEIIDKSNFYISAIPFPEKAVVLLDEVCVYTTQNIKSAKPAVISPQIVDTVLTNKIHVPVSIDLALQQKLLNLEKSLAARVVDQTEGITKLSAMLRKSFVVAGKRKKPLASFLLLGPTGVGKTETAKALAQVFFDSEKSIIRFDMSFYQTKESIADLVGSQQIAKPGLLTTQIRQKPYGVLLLDEIEKADHDLLNIFLTILDEGYFTDGYGKRVDCKNLIIIATSNAGSDFIYQNQSHESTQGLIDHLVGAKQFSPEFLNRFDGAVVYKPLSKQAITQIAKKMLTKIEEEVYSRHKVKFTISENFLDQLITEGYNPQLGARNMERVIRDKVEDHIAKLILSGTVSEGSTISF